MVGTPWSPAPLFRFFLQNVHVIVLWSHREASPIILRAPNPKGQPHSTYAYVPNLPGRCLWLSSHSRPLSSALCCGGGEGERGVSWESNNDTCTLPRVKRQLVGPCCRTQGAQPNALWRPRGLGWQPGGAEEGRGVRIHRADSLCGPAEMDTTLYSNYTPVKINVY